MTEPTTSLHTDLAKGLAGRVAVVTGSTSGIGLGIARALAETGVNIVVNGFGEAAAIEATCEGLRAFGGQIEYNEANLLDPAAARGLVESSIARFGRIDILVNNAGIQHVSPIETFPIEKWDAIIALNLSAAFHTIRTAFAPMKAAGFGRIINIASAHALVASPFKSAYVAAKHGLLGLTISGIAGIQPLRLAVFNICRSVTISPCRVARAGFFGLAVFASIRDVWR